MRHPKKSVRKTDNIWTFGKVSQDNGYMFIGSARIHQIVATAFYGLRDTKIYVVDHIDTNRQNNRLENLRWLTRLENVILNPITCKKIESLTGCKIEEVLTDISILHNQKLEPNLSWMKTVSQEEAIQTLHSLQKWSNSPVNKNTAGKWQKVDDKWYRSTNQKNAVIDAVWNSKVELLKCPLRFTSSPITAYAEKLCVGENFIVADGVPIKCVDFAAKKENDREFLFIKCVYGIYVDQTFADIIVVEVVDDCYIHTYDKFYPYRKQNQDRSFTCPYPWECDDKWFENYD
ncbi:MAG: HNH endonuclease [Lentisphaeria bacterium]|nr:HNH endonuclease [Lentisphaeria bacterium]